MDSKLIHTLAGMTLAAAAHNPLLVGEPGTGKTHLATAFRVAGNESLRLPHSSPRADITALRRTTKQR